MTGGERLPAIHVVAGAVTDGEGRVLIAQRPRGSRLAGGWEFPGGKLEHGEGRAAGLARELAEELGITIASPRPLIRVRHSYPTREILLDMWVITRYSGEPRGLDGQALRWCTRGELATVELLPADGPIVRALWLPERLVQVSTHHYRIGGDAGNRAPGGTPRGADEQMRGEFCARIGDASAAARAGADFLVLREVLADAELAELCGAIPIPVYARGTELEEAWRLGASGVNELGSRTEQVSARFRGNVC